MFIRILHDKAAFRDYFAQQAIRQKKNKIIIKKIDWINSASIKSKNWKHKFGWWKPPKIEEESTVNLPLTQPGLALIIATNQKDE